jgi:hypothetical protein
MGNMPPGVLAAFKMLSRDIELVEALVATLNRCTAALALVCIGNCVPRICVPHASLVTDVAQEAHVG